jgi:hypothetical protein
VAAGEALVRARLREAQLRWHPDKLVQKLGDMLRRADEAAGGAGGGSEGGQFEQAMAKAKAVMQQINALKARLLPA